MKFFPTHQRSSCQRHQDDEGRVCSLLRGWRRPPELEPGALMSSSQPRPSPTPADVLVTAHARVGKPDLMLGGRSDPDFGAVH